MFSVLKRYKDINTNFKSWKTKSRMSNYILEKMKSYKEKSRMSNHTKIHCNVVKK